MVLSKLWKFLKRTLGVNRRRHPSKKKRKRVVRPQKQAARRPRIKVSKKQRAPRKTTPKTKARPARQTSVTLGTVTHYYPKAKAAVVKLKRPLRIGDPVWIKGKATDFRQTVASMQIDRAPIASAKAGQEIGLEVLRDVSPGDILYG